MRRIHGDEPLIEAPFELANWRVGELANSFTNSPVHQLANQAVYEGFLPGPRKSDAGELPESAKRRLRGIEAETKVFLSVILVFVCGLMMVRV